MAFAIASSALSSFSTREVPWKFSPGLKVTTCMLGTSTRVNASKGVSSVCEPLPPDRPLWFPGSSPPEWLDGSLPGDFGFDPLGLGSDPELLKWFAQAELMHGRWAMLAVAGILIPEWLERLGFLDNFSWFEAGEREYFADPTTLFVVQLALMLAFVGFLFQAIYTGKDPIENLMDHIADPGHVNIFSAFTSQ